MPFLSTYKYPLYLLLSSFDSLCIGIMKAVVVDYLTKFLHHQPTEPSKNPRVPHGI